MVETDVIFQSVAHERFIKIAAIVVLIGLLTIALAQLLQANLFVMLFVTEACADAVTPQSVGLASKLSVPPCWMVPQ